DTFKTAIFGQDLETPIGLAAGPHTQMAQNIIAGWLCGARYIELKTIQTLDEIEVSKPCIDINDEGYNCEWSQELKIKQSFEEYLKAWIIIHILRHELKYSNDLGTVFNMSVGYDMKGILQDNVQRFFDKMKDCSAEKKVMIEEIREFYPDIDKIDIPDVISNNITLSTMHGCPSDEIEKIGHYLLTEKKLHTFIKLNPTLLGKDEINSILNKTMGYETHVPDVAFEHDIHFDAACDLITSLQQIGKDEDLFFGIKLTNTLEAVNHKDVFSEESMYMSGKALHPISINVAAKLRGVFPELAISFCGGVNAHNVADVLSCGLNPVTVCSDVLLPGGYTRLLQYLENINAPQEGDYNAYLMKYADAVKKDLKYQHKIKSIKTDRELGAYDCIFAPCVHTCPTHQNIPAYLDFANSNERFKALKTILETNPFPISTGMICDHSCQDNCTRINYDAALRIRDIKRFIAENSGQLKILDTGNKNDKKVSIIGAGPSGLSCAYYLQLAGCDVEIYESKAQIGGMLANAIPEFRLSKEALDWDIKNILDTGVTVHLNSEVNKESFTKIHESSDYLYIAAGAQKSAEANIPGSENISGVWDPLSFLASVRQGKAPDLGKNILILGGGNTAMDVSRTVKRLAGPESEVYIVYRRTKHEMPADGDEVEAALEEGIKLIELASPARVISKEGKLIALECHLMELKKSEKGGRPRPVIIPGKEFTIEADAMIPAFGQDLDIDFIKEDLLKGKLGIETGVENVFIGGDAYRGASFLIKAVADGKDVAQEIISRISGVKLVHKDIERLKRSREEHQQKLSRVIPGIKATRIDVSKRGLVNLVDLPMSEAEVKEEAARCLNCDEICDICITVCPNRANVGYELKPFSMKMQKLLVNNGQYILAEDKNFVIEQAYQILNIADYCNECGNCTSFCPTSGRPFADKPNIALCKESFNSLEKGYWDKGDHILYKEGEELYRLDIKNDKLVFSTENYVIELDKNFKVQGVELKKNWISDISLHRAVDMSVIKDAIESVTK
ncbi:MAG: FAD-dependent oxidoreductase, partial [Candidatus Marinimicrobia bacterium]|nr:FAD-dependent oxidoreductase [Candidatus Neomarinimicrobiota bacterium]